MALDSANKMHVLTCCSWQQTSRQTMRNDLEHCLGGESMPHPLPQFRSFLPYSFSKLSKKVKVVGLINSFIFRNSVKVHNPMDIEKNLIALNFDSLI
ncbi:hypothetical protein TNCV_4876341 [Trichonephila clavipes]|uniref:Uncharacterized protein n=1 Tax=Trichonephila clavipes TaxID=2585209 RepID=A0A8X6V2I8_TRICX|nr:hypothetical protein TNCV_4876341 [Trichonephila clavipes]